MSKVEVIKMKDRVIKLLRENPHTRSNDEALTSNIWYQDLLKIGVTAENVSAYDLLKHLSQKKLTNAESIRRSRQKIQQENPELRGENYKPRQDNQEEIIDQLK